MNMVKEVLKAIKSECEAKNDGNCASCPFKISGAWFDYCLFMGNVPHEGASPDMWALNEIKWERCVDKHD